MVKLELSWNELNRRIEEEEQRDNNLGQIIEGGMTTKEWLKAGIELEEKQ